MAGDPRVGIDIEAIDDTGPAFDSATGRIDALDQAAEQAGSGGFKVLAEGAAEAARTIEHGMSIMTRFDLVQITLEQSTDRLRQAQERYTQAVDAHGDSSAEAKAAAEELERAQANMEKTALRAELSMGLVAAQALTMAAQVPAAVGALTSLSASASTAAVAVGTLQVVATVGAAAVGITAGILALSSALGSVGVHGHEAADGLDDYTEATIRNRAVAAGDAREAIKEAQDRFDLERDTQAAIESNDQAFFQRRREALQADLAAQKALMDSSRQDRAFEASALRDEAIREFEALKADMARVTGTFPTRLTLTNEDDVGFQRLKAKGEQGAALIEQYRALQEEVTRLEAVIQGESVTTGQLGDASRKAKDDMAALVQVEKDAANAAEQNTEAMDRMRQQAETTARQAAAALSQMIPGFDGLSLAMQQAIATSQGLDASLLPAIQRAAAFEKALAAASEESRAAMLEQAAAAVDKQGKHTLLDKALEDGTITEQEYGAAVAASKARLDEQSAAAKARSAAAPDASVLPTWSPGPGGSNIAVPGAPQAFSSTDYGGFTRSVQRVGPQGATEMQAMALMDALDAAAKSNPALRTTGDWNQAYGMLTHMAQHGTSGNVFGFGSRVLQDALRGAGVKFAAQGYDGLVSKPTLFMAGENGREHVRVTPGGSAGGAFTLNGGIHVHQYGGTGGAAASSRGVLDGLTIAQRRAASRRSN